MPILNVREKESAGFSECAARFLQMAAAVAPQWYDTTGHWIAPSTPAHTRERFWLCFALYAHEAAGLADAVIRQGKTAERPQDWSIFEPNIACALLVQHRGKMATDVREKLEALTREAFGFKPGNRQPDFQFHGYNDNMPAKASLGLILGGELLDCPEAVEYGLWNLRQFRAMLVRRGVNSEFNSPTYTPLTLHALGEIAEHAQNTEARELARGLEERLWLDLAARFHPETGVLAGPYARAYTMDTLAHLSNVASLLWFHIGDSAHPSPMELFAPPSDLVLHHRGDVPFNIAQMSWLAAGHYHLPQAALRMLKRKEYPFRAVASCETGDGGADFPARAGRIETWLQPDFSVGTSSTPYGGGEQSANYFVTYRRCENVQSFRDVGTIFSKIVVDDDEPGTLKTSDDKPVSDGKPLSVLENGYGYFGEEDHLRSHANTITLQSQSTALVLTHPHLSLGGTEDEPNALAPRSLARISEMVIFPSHFGGADEIIIGEQARSLWDCEVQHGEWIVARRGRLFVGIRPMAYSRASGMATITLEKINNYEVIRATFYHGEKRIFARGELRHMFGGFVAEHASAQEYSSLAEFAAMLRQTRFTDYFWTTRRVRYRRGASTSRAILDMEVSLSSGAHEPRYATLNGRQIETSVLDIDGLRTEEIPFLQEPFQAVPAFFPWQDFKVAWENEWPYAINDREVE